MKILVCPLNWGLGHATRCIPIIQKLLAEKNEVIIAADGSPLQLLRQEFPSLRWIEFPSYKVQYSSKNSQIATILKWLPFILYGIVKEHYWLKKIIAQEHFDKVISDNRFGLWNRKIHSIYITHQLMIKMPRNNKMLEWIAWKLHRFIIQNYNECWIPDTENAPGLSGDLAHKYPLPNNAKFIGPISRFQNLPYIPSQKKFEVVVIVSGLEPQRTLFEQKMIQLHKENSYQTLIIQGQPQQKITTQKIGNITLISHLPAIEMASLLKNADKIFARSGYSTIMDLFTLNCLSKAVFFPTPGQTEQIYLSEIHSTNT